MATTRRFPVSHFEAVIPNAGTTTPEVDLLGLTLRGVYTPTALTGTAFTFLASQTSGGTFVAVRNEDGSAYTLTVAASRYTRVNPQVFEGLRFLKIVSGSAEGAARTLGLAARS